MSWTLIVVFFGIQGAYPTSVVVGNYSSLNVCQTEKANFIKDLLASNPANPDGTKWYFITACARRT